MTQLNLYTYPCARCKEQFVNVNFNEYPNAIGFVRGRNLATYMEIELGILYLVSDYHSIWNGSVFMIKDPKINYDEHALYCDDCIEKMLRRKKLDPVSLYKHTDPYQLEFVRYLV